jgi:pimeloyl-ACP methyl ester carboxylesterase
MDSTALPGFTHEYADANRIRTHYARAGEGPLIIFLHGFPQCWYEFRHQLIEFSRDHLTVAPDLRGYNLTGKPEHLQDYGVLPAVEDLRELVTEHLGYDSFVLVGHDWGGAVGWSFALHHPELLDRLVILCTAHPALLERELRESAEQQEASQYMLALRPPQGEQILSTDNYAVMRAQFEQFHFLDEKDLDVYHEAWSRPGALTGMVNWYRREGLGPPTHEGTAAHGDYAREVFSQVVQVPTLVLYPDDDIYVRPGCHRGLDRYVQDLTFKTVPGGSHWIAEELPEIVNAEIRQFLVGRPQVQQAVA